MNDFEWRLWHLDQRINDRGLPIDVEFCQAASRAAHDLISRNTELAETITKLENARSQPKLLQWVQEQGADIEDLRKSTIQQLLLQEDLDPELRKVLEARLQFTAISLKKYDELLASHVDGWLKGCFKFYGAHTGRWSGQRLQPHNLPRGILKSSEIDSAIQIVLDCPDMLDQLYDDPAGVLASLIRPTVKAPVGYKLVVADYASIETVVLAWLVGGTLLDVLQDGKDVYIDFASRLFSCGYDDISREQRTIAKPAVLGRGYGLGAPGLRRYAVMFGLDMSESEARAHIAAYDAQYPEVKDFWYGLDRRAKGVVRNFNTESADDVLGFRTHKTHLYIDLPSNRSLAYLRPFMKTVEKSWGPVDEIWYKDGTRGFNTNTWYGKLTENIVQALARDILAYGMLRADADPGLDVVGHVHDEIICLAKARDDTALERLEACMTAPEWCAGAPIKVEAWEGERYRKG